jgi:hypothetical protein
MPETAILTFKLKDTRKIIATTDRDLSPIFVVVAVGLLVLISLNVALDALDAFPIGLS